jgi:opacity protein-like surface antigen
VIKFVAGVPRGLYMSVAVGFSKKIARKSSKSMFRRSLLSAAAFALAATASTGAMAQNCGTLPSLPGFIFNNDWKSAFGAGIAGASAAAATINAVNTAFLTHSTAFVSAPPNPPPNSQGGGVWIRGVGGHDKISSGGSASYTWTSPAPNNVFNQAGTTTCSSTFSQTFAGVQLGADTARLNINGWNIHFGTTIGYLGSKGSIDEGATPVGGPFDTTTQAPFVGTYAAATYGGFFAEGLLRFNYYEMNLNSPSVNLYDQKLDAHGVSASGSVGYHWAIPNSQWFIEPSAGAVWSKTKIDPLQLAGAGTFGNNFQGTTQINDIESFIGRVGARVGTTFVSGNVVYQPFVAASLWHEFKGGWSANYISCPNCAFTNSGGAAPVITTSTLAASMDGSGIGTYGVYSVGIAGQIVNTGWLGYARFDYESGSEIKGWTASGGLRYQFTPEPPAPAFAKAPVPIVKPVLWTGFYVGGFGGVKTGGKADTTFDPRPAPSILVLAFPGATSDPQLAGVLGGGDIGYNYQMGKWVLGLEGDLAWTNTRGSKACGSFSADLFFGTPLFNSTCHDKLSWEATATARVGYAWDRALYYVKAGGAWIHEAFSVTCNLGPINGGVLPQSCYSPTTGALFNEISASDNRFGWTAGFGVEFALNDHWSAKAETDYLGFGSKNLTLTDGTTVSTKLHIWETKVGVNYRF